MEQDKEKKDGNQEKQEKEQEKEKKVGKVGKVGKGKEIKVVKEEIRKRTNIFSCLEHQNFGSQSSKQTLEYKTKFAISRDLA